MIFLVKREGMSMRKYFEMLVLTIVMMLGMAVLAHAGIPVDAAVYDGHSYKVYDISKTWMEAKRYCEILGGHIVTITSSKEQSFVNRLSKSKKAYWLGATDSNVEGSWEWITGEAWNYTNWLSGEPTGYNLENGREEDYASISFSSNYNGGWYDELNEAGDVDEFRLTDHGIICEWDEAYAGEGLPPMTIPESDMNNEIINSPQEEIKGSSYPLLQARAVNVKARSFTLKWNKLTGAEKYLIYGNRCGRKNRYQYIKETTKTSYRPKGLKKNKFYKYLVVAVSDNMVISVSKTVHVGLPTRPNPTKVKVNKKNVILSLSAIKTFQLECSVKGTKLKQHRKIKYETDNVNVARVNKAGLITAVGAGRCNIYAYAQNGVSAKIVVKVLK